MSGFRVAEPPDYRVVQPPGWNSGEAYWTNESTTPRGMRPSGPLWRASAMLVECPYCGAAPFMQCHTYGRPERPAPEGHAGRSWAGHALLKKALQAGIECQSRPAEARAALADEPDLPQLMEDDIVALIHRVLDEREAAKPKRTTRRAS